MMVVMTMAVVHMVAMSMDMKRMDLTFFDGVFVVDRPGRHPQTHSCQQGHRTEYLYEGCRSLGMGVHVEIRQLRD